MATGTSTTGPSGIGTEVLRRTYVTALQNTTSSVLTVGTDMIVTVLSIIVYNHDVEKIIDIYVHAEGSNSVFLVRDSVLGGGESFVWNDKFVMTETDILKVFCNGDATSIYCSYIEQEFA